MACLGGDPVDPRARGEAWFDNLPRIWVWYDADESTTEMEGRICTRGPQKKRKHTSPATCSSCIAYRGLRENGTVADGLDGSHTRPVALSLDEDRRYRAAVELANYEDDWSLLAVFFSRQERTVEVGPDGRRRIMAGTGERTRRLVEEDEDAIARHAASLRDWRAAHPGHDTRKYSDRPSRAAYMRAYRARQKAGAEG